MVGYLHSAVSLHQDMNDFIKFLLIWERPQTAKSRPRLDTLEVRGKYN